MPRTSNSQVLQIVRQIEHTAHCNASRVTGLKQDRPCNTNPCNIPAGQQLFSDNTPSGREERMIANDNQAPGRRAMQHVVPTSTMVGMVGTRGFPRGRDLHGTHVASTWATFDE